MPTLRLTVNDLILRVSDFLGYTDNTVPTGTDLTTVKDIVARGYRRFLYPVDLRTGQAYDWTFLRDLYTVVSENGKWQYQMPENFAEIVTRPVYGEDEYKLALEKRTPQQILDMRSSGSFSSFPYFYAVVPTGTNNLTGQYDEMWLYPTPGSTSYEFKFFIRIDPLKPDVTTEFLVGGVRACEAILESCLAAAEQQDDDKLDIHTQLADRLVQELIASDSSRDEDTTIGNLHRRQPRIVNPYDASTIDINNIWLGEGAH